MNYYEHHIGDYAAATSHLTLVEDAIYSRLLRRYYLQEAPLPSDVAQTARLCGARSTEEVAMCDAILREFFTLESDGWHNKRADEEIARFQDKQTKAKASAEARWSGRGKSVAKPSDSDGNADAMRTHSEGNAHQTPDTISKSDRDTHATPAGEAGKAMRVAGCTSLNLSHPDFQAAIAEDVTPKELADAVTASIGMGITGAGLFAYAVKVARTNHAKTAAAVVIPTARAGPAQGQSKTMGAILALEGMKHGLDQTRTADGLPEAPYARLGTSAGG